MNSSTRPFLELNKVNKGYTLDGNAFTVLDDISFYLEKGDLLTILGPSGCGKSTLIRSICGLETIDSGKISIDGKEVYKTGSDRIMVFQDFNQLFPWKTVLENVVYPLKLNNLYNSNTERKERAEHFLQMVHLQDFLNAYPNQLSGGMRQRVAIARSLALNPKVLLMDEPFGALDAQTRAILQQEILNIWQETGTTIIFITHNIQESIILGSKITVLSKLPASIKLFIENEIPIPRLPETPEFMKLWHTLYGELDVKRF
jgi:NitT/TauT family transport system ATP-binding protein